MILHKLVEEGAPKDYHVDRVGNFRHDPRIRHEHDTIF